MGGLAPVVALLAPRQPAGLQAAAAHLLGTAASNNHEFQRQLLADHPETLLLLLQLLGSGSSSSAASNSDDSGARAAAAAATAEAATKALYCLAAMLRLNADFRVAFYQAAGVQTLQLLLGALPQLQPGVRVHSVLSLLMDRLAK
jgi:DNA-binding GntR family transcriptional regulator